MHAESQTTSPSLARPPALLADVMTRSVVAVRSDMSLEEVTEVFLARSISGAPVIDDAGRPIGVVSKTDLLRAAHDAGDSGALEEVVERGYHIHEMAVPRVSDVMTPLVFSLSQDAPVARAAALMAFEGVHRVPVVDDDGVLVGIVSAIDVLRWMAREHGYVLPGRGDGR